MPDYDKPKVPPATPPVIDPNVEPVDASELAEDDGDSEFSGSSDASGNDGQIARDELRKLQNRDKLDWAGEQALDATTPETLLPPD